MAQDRPLEGAVALVTGAGRGIGKAIARRLGANGVRLILTGKSAERLDGTRAEFAREGMEAAAIPCDLADPRAAAAMAAEAVAVHDGLDILVNNAGAALKKPYEESSDAEWTHVMAVNAMAPFVLCRECLPALKRSNRAAIVNIGSVMGIKGYEHQAVYAASKHALMGFTKVMAQELQPHGVRVHAINPGGVYTDLVREMRPDLAPEILIQPEDIADITLFLLTHRNNAVIDDIHIRRANGSPWF